MDEYLLTTFVGVDERERHADGDGEIRIGEPLALSGEEGAGGDDDGEDVHGGGQRAAVGGGDSDGIGIMGLDQAPEVLAGRKERLARLLGDPETMETIYAHVANGGTIISLCETWDVRYSDVVRWIEGDEGRKKLYAAAVQARNEWADEMLVAEVRALARTDIRKLYYEKGHPREGQLKDMADLDPATARIVSSVEVHDIFESVEGEKKKAGEVKKVKMWDKLKSLEMGLKNRRLLIDKSEVESTIKLEDLLDRSMDEPAPEPAAAASTAATSPAPGAVIGVEQAAPLAGTPVGLGEAAPAGASAATPASPSVSPSAPAADASPAPTDDAPFK